MPGSNEPDIRGTGGQIDGMVLALIDAAYDREESVRETILKSLHDLGTKQTSLVLSSCHYYMRKHAKLAHGHRIAILKAMKLVVQDAIEQVEKPIALEIIKQVSEEMTQAKDVVPEWQSAASDVLVAMGIKYCTDVMEDLLQKFQPGVLPHFFVVQTMANLATVNVFDMVPFIKVVIGSMLPMLGMCKQDNMRWVFSSALAKFCEAILDYIANIEKAEDKSVRKEAFSSEVDSAYDVLFNVWLNTREAKLRLTIVDALGQMSHIMSMEKLQGELTKLLPGLFSLYKKHQEPFHITQGLCMILDASTEGGSVILEPYLDNLLNAMFPQVCQPMDYTNPMTVKNHNEVLRSFAILSKSFSDRTINFLLDKLNQQNEKFKMGTLAIIRHLVNSSSAQMEDKQKLILSGLKMVLQDPSNKVKKVLAQVIIAMAHHGYLEEEGGDLMIEFIVRQCSLPSDSHLRRSPDPDHVSADALRSMCENVLQLLSTTVENMDSVLWPHLLEYLLPDQYYGASSALCKNIAHIAERKKSDDDFEVDFETNANLPKPCDMLSRLLVMCGYPHQGRNRGLHVLQCMRALSSVINDNLVDLWDKVIPKLISYINDAEENENMEWSQKSWEDLLLKLLSKSLEQIGDEEWYVELGNSMSSQLGLYEKYSLDKMEPQTLTKLQHKEKNFLYKCLGVIMRRSTNREFVNKNLDKIFLTIKHDSQIEREGCAIACGFTAAAHIDLVLDKLSAVTKSPDSSKKSTGLFGFIKDSVGLAGDQKENIKATIMLCYGYVTLFAPPDVITSRLEGSVMRNIVPQFASVKDTAVKQNLTRAVELIGQALHPDHLKVEHKFTYRDDLLKHMQNYLKSENPVQMNNETRALVLDAVSALVKLDPVLSDGDFHDILSVCLLSVMSLPAEGISDKSKKEESYQEFIEQEKLTAMTLHSLHTFVQELLLKNMTPETLERILDHVSPWLTSQQDIERQRAVELSLVIMKLYLEKSITRVGHAVSFGVFGTILGRIIPRCTDPSLNVRQSAVDCVQTVIRINFKYQGKDPTFKDQMVDALPTLKDRLKRTDANVLFSVVNDLAKVLSKKTPNDQLHSLVMTTLSQLSDPHSGASSGVCVVLNGLLKSRGGELERHVEEIFVQFVETLEGISFPQTRTGTLRCIRTLATHHFNAVLGFLLGQQLPYNTDAKECWAVIGQDKELCEQSLGHLLDTLMRCVPYEEKADDILEKKKNKPGPRTATLSALSCTCALTEIFRVAEAAESIAKLYPRLLSCLLLNLASLVGCKPPKVSREVKDKKGKPKKVERTLDLDPCTVAVEACKQLLLLPMCSEFLETLDHQLTWTLLQDKVNYAEGITTLVRCLVSTQKEEVSPVISSLMPAVSSPYEPQRVMVAAFFAELINNRCGGDMQSVEMLVNSLLGKLVDTSLTVRKYCIRGLGNVSSSGAEQVQKFSTTVLSAMMAGMDDKDDLDDDITLEAMNGLSKILAVMSEEHIRAILINIALRIRPCFEKDRESVRNAAFTLFGNLARFGDGQSRDTFLEQIHSNLVSLLLHLNDPDADVRRACKVTLRHLGPLLGSEQLNTMFQKHLIESAGLHYGEFMNDLSKILIQDFEEKLNFYIMGCLNFFKSSWPEIRSNAALFTGFVMGNMRQDDLQFISREIVCSALTLLLRDSHVTVRMKAAEAVSLLHQV